MLAQHRSSAACYVFTNVSMGRLRNFIVRMHAANCERSTSSVRSWRIDRTVL